MLPKTGYTVGKFFVTLMSENVLTAIDENFAFVWSSKLETILLWNPECMVLYLLASSY